MDILEVPQTASDTHLQGEQGLVFIVDDVEGNRVLAAAYLEALGWRCEAFDNGHAALRALRERVPEAMLIDISMPELSGDELVRLVRESPRTEGIRLVGYTAHAMADEVQRMRAGGLDEILVKPVLLPEMRRVFPRRG